MEWMVWTPSVVVFYVIILVLLISMTVWELISPTIERKGFLPIVTTRGDRFFISLLGSAFINLLWLGLTDLYQLWAVLISIIYALFIAKWG